MPGIGGLWQDNPCPRVWERSVPHIDQPEVEKNAAEMLH